MSTQVSTPPRPKRSWHLAYIPQTHNHSKEHQQLGPHQQGYSSQDPPIMAKHLKEYNKRNV
eukprot:5066443-Ditylum_brightwellii.AAC.1